MVTSGRGPEKGKKVLTMPKYIDAASAATIIAEKHGIPIADLVDTFADIPAADVVEVVRCKDCRYCDISLLLPIGRKMYTCMDGVHDHQMLMKPYDFCSNGKRREGADNEP